MKKDDLKIVFFGTPEFAVASLDSIHSAGYHVAAVVTMPDKPAGRGHRLFQSPVKQWAVAHGIDVLQPVSLKDEEFLASLRAIGANLFVVIAFRMLPRQVWQMPSLGTFNLHASLLPHYRGAAPINHAIMNGETLTGVTTFFLKHEIDTGDVICREAIGIDDNDDAGSLHDKLMALGARVTVETLRRIVSGEANAVSQSALAADESKLKSAPKIFRETCEIDWNRPASAVRNHVRGLSPYPAAWSRLKLDEISGVPEPKIFEVRISANKEPLSAGQMKIVDDTILVGTADTNLEIVSLQMPGKKRMLTADFLRGLHL